MQFFDMFRRGNSSVAPKNEIIEELDSTSIHENVLDHVVKEIPVNEDRSDDSLLEGSIESVSESVISKSPVNVTKLIEGDDIKIDQLLGELKSDYSLDNTFKENEEMSRDSIIGSAITLFSDDVCQVHDIYKTIVHVEAKDEKLAQFLQDFLEHNVNIEDRVWEWTYEVVKHGDFKLRRREYYVGPKEKGVKDVYYENVLESYKVSRIEYMGKVLGYLDSEFEEGKTTFEKPESFVHFLNSRLPRREKVKLKVKVSKGEKQEEVVCSRVNGTSVMDNARYIYRVVNLLDNMLIMSRVARSTQYNLIKIEVGNASPAQTQQILNTVRRSIEGSTKMKKGNGMKSDPSPIPVNSNVYIPTREGKGDVTVDSVNESVDVRAITDIDYFRNKEFATINVPKAYLGFEEELPGSMGNSSLVKLDIRYARPVQKVQTIIRYGIEELCKNYLLYRGRVDDIDKFDIVMRPVVSAESAAKVEEFIANLAMFDSSAGMLEAFSKYIDKAKFLKTVLALAGIAPADIGNDEFMVMLKDMENGTYKSEVPKAEEDDE